MKPSDPAALSTDRPGRRAELVSAARHLLETEGVDALTTRRVGATVGMRLPSVYKHVPDNATVEHELMVIGLTEQGQALQDATATFPDLAREYRAWAVAHPHLHRLINDRPPDRARLPEGLEERPPRRWSRPAVVTWPLHGQPGRPSKGLVDLELAGRFPPDTDLDAVYGAAARAYATGTGRTP